MMENSRKNFTVTLKVFGRKTGYLSDPVSLQYTAYATISDDPVRSGICHDSVTKRVDTITATTPVGAEGTSPATYTSAEPARVRGVVS